jgi:hypothetical protein
VALISGEVDLIGTYWSDADRRNHPGWHATKISNDVDGVVWYVRALQQDCGLSHAISTTVKKLSKDDKSNYWRNIKVPEECESQHG